MITTTSEALALLGKDNYTASGDKSIFDLWRHFTTRGHQARVQCVDAGFQAGFVVSGGVDYTTRVWKYDDRYMAYDLVAVLEIEKPHFTPVPDDGWQFFRKLANMVMPPKVDWDLVPTQGVTAVVQSESVANGKSARNGPVLSGTADGDLFVLSLTKDGTEDGFVQSILGLHQGAITDICVAATYPEGNMDGTQFLVLTASADGTAVMLEMKCRETNNPGFEHQRHEERPSPIFDCLFCGGGGRNNKASSLGLSPREALREVKEEEEEGEEEEQAETCLELVSIRKLRTLEHGGKKVLQVQHLGDNRRPGLRASFVTLTEEGIWLWNLEGERLMKLRIQSRRGTKLYEPSAAKDPDTLFQSNVTKHISLAVVNKGENSLLFASGEGLTAVWGFEYGIPGILDEGGVKYDEARFEQRKFKFDKDGDDAHAEPLCVYKRDGTLLDIDQSGVSTTFAVNLSEEITVEMWNTEAVAPGLLVIEPPGPASLLIKPGREATLFQLRHSSQVCDLRVVEDVAGPALVTGCDEGAIFLWDLEGGDAGQIYASLRSMKPLEIVLPPIMLLVSAAQVLSFAFGPAVPWKKEVHEKGKIVHSFMMLDFKYTVTIPKEDIFWPELCIICFLIVFFQLCALTGAPQVADALVREAEHTAWFKGESSVGPMHLAVKVLKGLRAGLYLAMQFLSTVLVVPMMQSCAQAVECIRPDDTPWTDYLLLNPRQTIYLQSAPAVKCYTGAHLHLILCLAVIVPTYLILLVPYAVVSGDAHYVPRSTLYDYQFWRPDNTWRKAAVRKATGIHLAFLHLRPSQAFRTLFLDLVAKIVLPVVTTLTMAQPKFQMVMVTSMGFLMWVNSVANAPYVERKFCVVVQDLKLFTVLTMMTGCFTVFLDDCRSMVPIYMLIASSVLVVALITSQLCSMTANRPFVRSYAGARSAGERRPNGAKEAAQGVASYLSGVAAGALGAGSNWLQSARGSPEELDPLQASTAAAQQAEQEA